MYEGLLIEPWRTDRPPYHVRTKARNVLEGAKFTPNRNGVFGDQQGGNMFVMPVNYHIWSYEFRMI